jgi:hypothetical protein
MLRTYKPVRVLFISISAILIGCLSPDSGSESGSVVDIVVPEAPAPDTYACDPFDSYVNNDESLGVVGNFFYLNDDQPRFGRVSDYIELGQAVDDIVLYLNQIFVPTRPFDRGFITMGGQAVLNSRGEPLYEYFALRLNGRLSSGSWAPGNYQFALLSDDGAVFDIDTGSGFARLIDNDGNHPTRMKCATEPLALGANPVSYQLDYYQGPKYHIALMLMARPWPSDNNWNDAECGKEGNSRYFDSTQNPPAPTATYNGLLARGWRPLEQANYLMPQTAPKNPCNTPAPVISNFRVLEFSANSVTLAWSTDVPSKSEVFYGLQGAGFNQVVSSALEYKTTHSLVVTGLTANSNYEFKVNSWSTSGLSSESGAVTVRTRR